MAVKRLQERRLERVKIPTENETFTNAYFYGKIKYRIWYSATPPPLEHNMPGNIWRQKISGSTDRWWMRREDNSGWDRMEATTTQTGMMSASDKAKLDGITPDQLRSITISTVLPSSGDGDNGDIWIRV